MDLSGWWFGCHFLFSHILGISSSQLIHIFQRGGPGPPTSYGTTRLFQTRRVWGWWPVAVPYCRRNPRWGRPGEFLIWTYTISPKRQNTNSEITDDISYICIYIYVYIYICMYILYIYHSWYIFPGVQPFSPEVRSPSMLPWTSWSVSLSSHRSSQAQHFRADLRRCDPPPLGVMILVVVIQEKHGDRSGYMSDQWWLVDDCDSRGLY